MRALVLVAAGAVVAIMTPGCFGNECEGDVYPLDTEYGLGMQGNLVDATTWESVPMDERNEGDGRLWLDFPARRTWRMAVPQWIDGAPEPRPVAEMTGYVSFSPRPNRQVHCGLDRCDPADNFTEGTGNIVEWKSVANGRVQVTNDTCSHFYLRVVLHAGAPAPDAGVPDAQSPEPR
jgi:hypothetical protein